MPQAHCLEDFQKIEKPTKLSLSFLASCRQHMEHTMSCPARSPFSLFRSLLFKTCLLPWSLQEISQLKCLIHPIVRDTSLCRAPAFGIIIYILLIYFLPQFSLFCSFSALLLTLCYIMYASTGARIMSIICFWHVSSKFESIMISNIKIFSECFPIFCTLLVRNRDHP